MDLYSGSCLTYTKKKCFPILLNGAYTVNCSPTWLCLLWEPSALQGGCVLMHAALHIHQGGGEYSTPTIPLLDFPQRFFLSVISTVFFSGLRSFCPVCKRILGWIINCYINQLSFGNCSTFFSHLIFLIYGYSVLGLQYNTIQFLCWGGGGFHFHAR